METKKVILIDLDDTLTNFVPAWCNELNKKHNTNVTENDVTDWEIAKFFPNLTKEQVFEPINCTEFWDKVEPKQGAVEYVKRLFDDGHEIYVCTATYYPNVATKYELIIKRYFPFIDWNHMIIARNKQMIMADYLIDDGIHNLIGGKYRGILFDSPHNRGRIAGEIGLIRAMNWAEVYEIISEDKCE